MKWKSWVTHLRLMKARTRLVSHAEGVAIMFLVKKRCMYGIATLEYMISWTIVEEIISNTTCSTPYLHLDLGNRL